MGLFSGDEFKFENVLKLPFKTAESGLKFGRDFIKDPKSAFGKNQDRMTDILAGIGFDRDNDLVKNSDAVAAAVVGSIFAAPMLGGGAAAGGGAGATGGGMAGAGTAGAGAGAGGGLLGGAGATTGAGAGGTTAGAGGEMMGSLQSGSWLSNPYTQVGMNLLQQQNQTPQMQMQPMQFRGAQAYGGLM